jgi:hypothetical protein
VLDGKKVSDSGSIATNSDASVLAEGFVYGLNFNVGANVAAGDVNGDGLADIVTGATAGNPHTKVFDARQSLDDGVLFLLHEYFPYALNFNIGVFVTVADYDRDGFYDVITGATAGNPEVSVLSGKDFAKKNVGSWSEIERFFAFPLGQNTGVTVGARDLTGDGRAEIFVGSRSVTSQYEVFENNWPMAPTILPEYSGTAGVAGVYVAL